MSPPNVGNKDLPTRPIPLEKSLLLGMGGLRVPVKQFYHAHSSFTTYRAKVLPLLPKEPPSLSPSGASIPYSSGVIPIVGELSSTGSSQLSAKVFFLASTSELAS